MIREKCVICDGNKLHDFLIQIQMLLFYKQLDLI